VPGQTCIENGPGDHNERQIPSNTRIQILNDDQAVLVSSVGNQAQENASVEGDEQEEPEVDGVFDSMRRQRCMLNLFITAQAGIEAAFLVPHNVFKDIWRLHSESALQEPHTIVLTIPFEQRVASAVLSVPRADALRLSLEFSLQRII